MLTRKLRQLLLEYEKTLYENCRKNTQIALAASLRRCCIVFTLLLRCRLVVVLSFLDRCLILMVSLLLHHFVVVKALCCCRSLVVTLHCWYNVVS
jgi:hypothetical protein